MKTLLAATAILLAMCSHGMAEPSKHIQAITCTGDHSGAHTLVIGKCSFEGEEAGKVVDTCKRENDVCVVKAHGWWNGHGMYIVTSVESVQVGNDDTVDQSALNPDELKMAKQCKARRPCSLTCNRAHDAGRDDLIKAGACAE